MLYSLAALIARLSPGATEAWRDEEDDEGDVMVIEPRFSLAELGLDSLDQVRLLCQIEEHFGVQLDEEGLRLVETLGQLARLVDQARTGSTAAGARPGISGSSAPA